MRVSTGRRTVLRDLIDERGWRYSYVADQIGVAPAVLSRIMSGKRPLNAGELVKLQNLLGVQYFRFFDGDRLRFSDEEEQG